ncbi:MAG: hypothetical protein AB1487_00265, partial [Thermodesulfobacteriota bacterium]
GPENVFRVQEWRRAHPGYWRRKASLSREALQDLSPEKTKKKQKVVLLSRLRRQYSARVRPLLSWAAKWVRQYFSLAAGEWGGRGMLSCCMPMPPLR